MMGQNVLLCFAAAKNRGGRSAAMRQAVRILVRGRWKRYEIDKAVPYD